MGVLLILVYIRSAVQIAKIDIFRYLNVLFLMNVSLTPELEKWVQSKVETGLYSSSSEVVREALRTQYQFEGQKLEKLSSLRADLQLGVEQLKSGHSELLNPALIEKVKREGKARKYA